jgi:hypothetical protein
MLILIHGYRDDLVLYTTTSDSVLRIFTPVLDSLQYLQLHGAIDVPFTPLTSKSKGKSPASEYKALQKSSIFHLDRKVLGDALNAILKEKLLPPPPSGSEEGIQKGTHSEDEEDARKKKAMEVVKEGWDLFLRVMQDGSIHVTAVAVRIEIYPCAFN